MSVLYCDADGNVHGKPPFEKAFTQAATLLVYLPNADTARSILAYTNAKRVTAPNTSPLTWSNDLATLAQTRANYNLNDSVSKKTLSLTHGDLCLGSGSQCPNVGQNLAIETGGTAASAAKNSVDGWYNEKSLWDRSKGDAFLSPAGHYTQLMWKDTTQVGCAIASGTLNGQPLYSTACNYSPYGNVAGKFTTNVAAPLTPP